MACITTCIAWRPRSEFSRKRDYAVGAVARCRGSRHHDDFARNLGKVDVPTSLVHCRMAG
ncbi:MAG: hypothetical protein QOC63_5022 [Mycobacterium sp.]|jgi:hypothetical protein|nr:hypothetical protein [Mycobacterium sp.]